MLVEALKWKSGNYSNIEVDKVVDFLVIVRSGFCDNTFT